MTRLLALSLTVWLSGFAPALAGDASADKHGDSAPTGNAAKKPFTNADLATSAPPEEGAVTNADLVGIEGNVTESEPGDETTYPYPWPRGRETRANEAWLDANKRDYQARRRRLDRIEEELPQARDRAEREVGQRFVVVNGILVGVPGLPGDQPAHEYLQALEDEERELQEATHEIEMEARQHGFGSAALMKR